MFARQIASAAPAGGFYTLVAQVLCLLAVLIAIKALFHDRSRGRARCRCCWYTLPHDRLDPCPECGCKPRRQKDLYRTRRSRWWLFVALMVCVIAGGVWYWPHVQHRRKVLGESTTIALVPTTYWVWLVPRSDQNQWLELCYRVSGIGPNQTSGFGSGPSFPGSGISCSRLDAAPVHLGYPLNTDEKEGGHLGIGLTGTYLTAMPEAGVWHWQGQYLLDQLLAVALDSSRGILKRQDAFFLYDAYTRFRKIEHVKAVYPLLMSKDADQFGALIGDGPWWWGADALDAHEVEDELRQALFRVSDNALQDFNVAYGYAVLGMPAAEAVKELWASSDPAMRERGTSLMGHLVDCIFWARVEGWTLDRDTLDAGAIADLFIQAAVDGDVELFMESKDWLKALTSLEPSDSNPVDDGTVIGFGFGFDDASEEVLVEPDAFHIAFIKKYLDWSVQRVASGQDEPAVVGELLEASLDSLHYLDHDHPLWEDILDAADALLKSSNDVLVHKQAVWFYQMHIYPYKGEDEPAFSAEEIDQLEQRVRRLKPLLVDGPFEKNPDEMLEALESYRQD